MRINRRVLISAAGIAALPWVKLSAEDSEIQADARSLLKSVPGVTSAYGRRYVRADDSHITDWPVKPSEMTPDYLLVMMITFESRATAIGVFNMMLNPEIAGVIMDRDASGLEQSVNEALPEGNVTFTGMFEAMPHPYSYLLALPLGDTILLINTRADTHFVQLTVDNIAKFIADQPKSDEPVQVIRRGEATGGVFDMMPGADEAELLRGLVPMWDYDLMVSDSPVEPAGATPEASPTHKH